MFDRPYHRRIHRLLGMMNDAFLEEIGCCFGGGTCAALLLDEYRESVDIDFLCSSRAGYRALRNTVTNVTLGELFHDPPRLLREIRADRYGIRTVLGIEDTPIKFEVVLEGRIPLGCERVSLLPVPILDRRSQMAEKLLANCDRWGDRSVCARDVIDFMMMCERWGEPDEEVWGTAEMAYGRAVRAALDDAVKQLRADPPWLAECFSRLRVQANAQATIRARLVGR